jgi:hypothetical protein
MNSTPLLRAVNETNNSATAAAATPCPVQNSVQQCEQAAKKSSREVVLQSLTRLSTGCSQAFQARVHEYLTAAKQSDQMMLDAWTRIGHQDCLRSPRVDLLKTNEQTMSPLGVACLISYARGWLDEIDRTNAAKAAAKPERRSSLATKPTVAETSELAPAMQPAPASHYPTRRKKRRTKHLESSRSSRE